MWLPDFVTFGSSTLWFPDFVTFGILYFGVFGVFGVLSILAFFEFSDFRFDFEPLKGCFKGALKGDYPILL